MPPLIAPPQPPTSSTECLLAPPQPVAKAKAKRSSTSSSSSGKATSTSPAEHTSFSDQPAQPGHKRTRSNLTSRDVADVAAELDERPEEPLVNRWHRALWGRHEPRWLRRAHNGIMGTFGDKYIVRD